MLKPKKIQQNAVKQRTGLLQNRNKRGLSM